MPDSSLSELASPEVLARARKIKLFLMDVDSTLTDGGVCLISSTAADGSGAAIVSEMKVLPRRRNLWVTIRSNGRRKLGSRSPRTRCGIARLQLFLFVASCLSNLFALFGKRYAVSEDRSTSIVRVSSSAVGSTGDSVFDRRPSSTSRFVVCRAGPLRRESVCSFLPCRWRPAAWHATRRTSAVGPASGLLATCQLLLGDGFSAMLCESVHRRVHL
jgi:hypothetical protein